MAKIKRAKELLAEEQKFLHKMKLKSPNTGIVALGHLLRNKKKKTRSK